VTPIVANEWAQCAEASCGISPIIDLLPIAAGTAEKTSLLAIAPGVIDNTLIENENWQLWGHVFQRARAGRLRVFYATQS
jgi:hypothetical protein